MTTEWLDVLIQPSDTLRRRSIAAELRGAALLLDGQLIEYSRQQQELDLPELGELANASGSPGRHIIAAIGIQFSGETDAWRIYASILERNDLTADQRICVSILSGIALADADESARAGRVLDAALTVEAETAHTVLLHLHRGMRFAEADMVGEALSATLKAQDELQHLSSRRKWAPTLRAIAQYNEWALSGLSGEFVFHERRPRRDSPPLSRVHLHQRAALARYLQNEYDAALRTVSQRVIGGRVEDPIDRDLYRAVLRAECLADWYELQDARQLLGRYRIKEAIGRPSRGTTRAFQLLRRARDDKGLGLAATALRTEGPIEALRDATIAFAQGHWARHEEASIAEVLAAGADLLDEDLSEKTITKVVNRVTEFHRREYWILVLARLANYAPVDLAVDILSLFKGVLDNSPTSYLAREVARGITELNWSRIPDEARRPWIDYLNKHFMERGDEGVISEALAETLFVIERDAVVKTVSHAVSREPRLSTTRVAINADVRLDQAAAAAATGQSLELLSQIRADAAKGKYTFFATPGAHVLAHLLITYDGTDAEWQRLVEFLSDPVVADSSKIDALEYLSRHADDIPEEARNAFRKRLQDLEAFHDPLMGSKEALAGAVLRLGLALSAIEEVEAFSRLVALATKESPEARRQASRGLVGVYERSPSPAVLTLALILTRDVNAAVRADAGRSLALLDGGPEEFKSLRVDRLLAMLRDPGVLVPLLTLRGLAEGDSRHLPREVLAEVSELANQHASETIRRAAQACIEQAGS